jgi:aspartyl-tRNA(Asn)/glutamyl-tRNA(Gln) amidotransferase subunit C
MVDKKQVEYAANLARIEISGPEKEFLAGQLSKILDYIDQLEELDTEGVEPLRGADVCANVFREDKAQACDCREDILGNAPDRQDGYFKIPNVIE